MRLRAWSIIVESVAILMVGSGIGIEVSYGADAGWVLISSGAWLAVVGGFLWAKVLRK